MNPLLDKYRLAFEISPVPMLLVSPSGTIEMVNSGLNELFGYDPGELKGQCVEVLIPDSVKEYHPQLRDAYFRVPTKRGMGVGRDLYGKNRSGAVIPLELALEPVPIEGEKWAMVAAVDISQRKAQEERLRLAMDASASAMIMVDAVGDIVFANKAAVELFGYEESDLVGSSVERLVPESARRAHPVYRSSFMSASKPRPMGPDQKLFALHCDGREIPVEIALTPVGSGVKKLVMSTIIDLSDHVEAERLMMEKARELEELNIELSHFAYSASHDLKAPLSTIIGLLNICIEDLDDGNLEELRVNLKRAVEIGKRSSTKIEGVLRIARAGREATEPELVQLEELVRQIWEDLSASFDNALELQVSLGEDQTVFTERSALHIILDNLLSNAIRYRDLSKDRLSVTVTAVRHERATQFRVSDNGIGIASQSQHLVFEMFRRLDERSADGLGLTLVKKQIERLGGTIELESEEGVGTTMIFTIPDAGGTL